jgi:hypothetical protein
MKAVIVELVEDKAVVLCKNGDFMKVKKCKDYEVGKEVDISSVTNFKMSRLTKMVSAAAAVLLVAGLGYGFYTYNTPYSYLNIDINPSVEIATNVYDRIISVKPLNDDGQKLLELGSYKNMKLEDGVEELLQDAKEKGYFNNEQKNAVMITVSGKDEDKVAEIQDEVKDTAEAEVKQANKDAQVVVEKIPLVRHQEAEKLGISPGKMLLIEKLKTVNPEIKPEDYVNKPVKEILSAINDKKKESKIINKEDEKNQNVTQQQKTTVKQQDEDQKEQQDKAEQDKKDNKSRQQKSDKDKEKSDKQDIKNNSTANDKYNDMWNKYKNNKGNGKGRNNH